jgi:hypothetical protein
MHDPKILRMFLKHSKNPDHYNVPLPEVLGIRPREKDEAKNLLLCKSKGDRREYYELFDEETDSYYRFIDIPCGDCDGWVGLTNSVCAFGPMLMCDGCYQAYLRGNSSDRSDDETW